MEKECDGESSRSMKDKSKDWLTCNLASIARWHVVVENVRLYSPLPSHNRGRSEEVSLCFLCEMRRVCLGPALFRFILPPTPRTYASLPSFCRGFRCKARQYRSCVERHLAVCAEEIEGVYREPPCSRRRAPRRRTPRTMCPRPPSPPSLRATAGSRMWAVRQGENTENRQITATLNGVQQDAFRWNRPAGYRWIV